MDLVPHFRVITLDFDTTIKDFSNIVFPYAKTAVADTFANITTLASNLTTDLMNMNTTFYADAPYVYYQDPGHVITDPNTLVSAGVTGLPILVLGPLSILCGALILCRVVTCVALPCCNPTQYQWYKTMLYLWQAALSALVVLSLVVVLTGVMWGASLLTADLHTITAVTADEAQYSMFNRWSDIISVITDVPNDVPPNVALVNPGAIVDRFDPVITTVDSVIGTKSSVDSTIAAINGHITALTDLLGNVTDLLTTTEASIQALGGPFAAASLSVTMPSVPPVDSSDMTSTVAKIDGIADSRATLVAAMSQVDDFEQLSLMAEFMLRALPRDPMFAVTGIPDIISFYQTRLKPILEPVQAYYDLIPSTVRAWVTPAAAVKSMSGLVGLSGLALVTVAGFLLLACCAGCVSLNIIGKFEPNRYTTCCSACVAGVLVLGLLATLAATVTFYRFDTAMCGDIAPFIDRTSTAVMDSATLTSLVGSISPNITIGRRNVIVDLLDCQGSVLDIFGPDYLVVTGIADLMPVVWDYVPPMLGYAAYRDYLLGADIPATITTRVQNFVASRLNQTDLLDRIQTTINSAFTELDTIRTTDWAAAMDHSTAQAAVTTATAKVNDKTQLGWDPADVTSALSSANTQISNLGSNYDSYHAVNCPGAAMACICMIDRAALVTITWDDTPAPGHPHAVGLDAVTSFTACLQSSGFTIPAPAATAVDSMNDMETAAVIIEGLQADLVTPTTGKLPLISAELDALLVTLQGSSAIATSVKSDLDTITSTLAGIDGPTLLDPLYNNITVALAGIQTTALGYLDRLDVALDCSTVGQTIDEVRSAACYEPQTYLIIVMFGLLWAAVFASMQYCAACAGFQAVGRRPPKSHEPEMHSIVGRKQATMDDLMCDTRISKSLGGKTPRDIGDLATLAKSGKLDFASAARVMTAVAKARVATGVLTLEDGEVMDSEEYLPKINWARAARAVAADKPPKKTGVADAAKAVKDRPTTAAEKKAEAGKSGIRKLSLAIPKMMDTQPEQEPLVESPKLEAADDEMTD